MDSALFWIWLSLRCTVGGDTFSLLRKTFPLPSDVYRADKESLQKALFPSRRDLKALCDKDLTRARNILDYCAASKVRIITYDSPQYPETLKEIDSPPVLLYCLGNLPAISEKLFVSIVGTRKMTEYGERKAFEIASDLATAGAVVVSGMALGVDGVSHVGAISGGGRTVAILGCGIDRVYPPVHKRLESYIINNGAVITEYPPGTPPDRQNFPRRNRLISAISKATVVIEGPLISGALITGRLALKQGRPLYALPGDVDEKDGSCTAVLLKEGAKCITCADDILSDFSREYIGKINIFKLLDKIPENIKAALSRMGAASSNKKTKNQVKKDVEVNALVTEAKEKNEIPLSSQDKMSDEEKAEILSSLSKGTLDFYNKIPENETVYIEAVADGVSINDAMSATTMLEVYGLIEVFPGNRIRKK